MWCYPIFFFAAVSYISSHCVNPLLTLPLKYYKKYNYSPTVWSLALDLSFTFNIRILLRGRPFLCTVFLKRTMFGWMLTHPPIPSNEHNQRKIRTTHGIICRSYLDHVIGFNYIGMHCFTTTLHLHEPITITSLQLTTFQP